MAGAAELVDRAVALPPGPELAAVLNGLPWEEVPNARLVEVVQARSRQLAYDQAELLAGMVEISHAIAVKDLPGDRGEAVVRVGERFGWASHEIAAGLTWTPTAADRELGFAIAVVERLPLVFAALRQGRIDRGKARVFVDYLDPANGEVSEEQSRRLGERFVPQAPGLTTKQLSDRLYRALHALDPELRRRRYRRAVRERGVALYLDPRTGTATLVGNGLPRTRPPRRPRGWTGWSRPPSGPGIRAPGSPAVHSLITSGSGTAIAVGRAVPARPAARIWTTPAIMLWAGRPSTPTSGPGASDIIRTRSAAGRSLSPSRGYSGGSVPWGGSMSRGASRFALIFPTRTPHRAWTRRPIPKPLSGFAATTRGSWNDPPRTHPGHHHRNRIHHRTTSHHSERAGGCVASPTHPPPRTELTTQTRGVRIEPSASRGLS